MIYNKSNVQKEKDLQEALINIATVEKCMILSFIAPDTNIRTSPINYDSTTISMDDLYRLEEEFEKRGDNIPDILHIIIHTPGGEIYSTIKIAKYLRSKFKYISAYIPYEAASGGTMLCLIADEIIMSEVANLTPIDPQIMYKGQRIGVGSYQKAIDSLDEILSTLSIDEITSPYSNMSDQLDPVIWQEMEKSNKESILIAYQLLISHTKSPTKSKKKILYGIAENLACPENTHDHIIDFQEAKELGLNVIDGRRHTKYKEKLNYYKQLVKTKINEESLGHVINSFLPDNNSIIQGEEPNIGQKQEDSIQVEEITHNIQQDSIQVEETTPNIQQDSIQVKETDK